MSPSGAAQLWNEMRFSVVSGSGWQRSQGFGTKWLLSRMCVKRVVMVVIKGCW